MSEVTASVEAKQSIRRLLVANRGEIARRVFRTARALGIETIAVFSEPDRDAAHVRDADIAVALGGSTSAESYLDVDKILAAATKINADAIHPGYGFLSENAQFAQRVADAGLIWVGPTPESIRLMAGKVEAKRLAADAGVPLVPGAELPAEVDGAELIETAAAVGYPLLVKASAGGGGKGMRLVESSSELLEAVAGAKREAQASFGDATVFFERYLQGAHHVEVQVFGDTQGNVVHLRERECSIQRRHQKIVEESPSPNATAATLERMYAAAVALTKSIGYVGAGTVEFMVAGTGAAQEFFFLEMNTRLQVEHPVTEATTAPALDLVAWQLAVATGAPLPLTQDQLAWSGAHAIEVRLYAEDPGRDFLPSSGTLVAFAEAAGDAVGDAGFGPRRVAVRYDLSVESGDTTTPFYDPMIGKIIGSGATRAEAAEGLAVALAARDIVGITTNRDSLVAILRSPAFLAGDTTTHFIDEHPDLLVPRLDADARGHHLVAAALTFAEADTAEQPWRQLVPLGWRNVSGVPSRSDWSFAEAGESSTKAVLVDWQAAGQAAVSVLDADDTAGWTGTGRGGEPIRYRIQLVQAGATPTRQPAPGPAGRADANLELEVGGVLRRYRVGIAADWVWVNDGVHSTAYQRVPRFRIHTDAAAGSGPSAPVPGTIVAVAVADGDAVEEGQTLVVLEAMKMEHRIAAPADGVVEEVLVVVGQAVDAHQLLVKLHAPEGE